MAKRIVSGIFVLTALGALGVILAGALTSGEQLIVRFLTAVTVAALGLYVISDLRMQGEESDAQNAERQNQDHIDLTVPEPDSTVAYMSSVTGRHRAIKAESVEADTANTPGPGTFEPVETVTRAPAHAVEPANAAMPATAARPADSARPADTASPADMAHPPSVPANTLGRQPAHPKPDGPIRAMPPHPNTVLSRTVPASEAPTEPFASALADTAPLPKLAPVDDDPDVTDPNAVPVGGEADRSVPADRAAVLPVDFGYSGPLRSEDVDWPPKPESEVSTPVTDGLLSDLAFGVTDDGVETQDVPLPDLETAADSVEEEYGPVTVDELLGDLDTDLSAPLPRRVGLSEILAADPKPEDDETAPAQDPEPVQEATTVSTPASEVRKRPHLVLVTSEAASRQIEASHYAPPIKGELVDMAGDEPEQAAHPPIAGQPKHQEDDSRLDTVIRSGEMQVISTLIQQGMLSTSGPITDRDVRTMVYVAFTSNELRKLIRSGGTPDRIRTGDIDLGPVEVFDERRYAPLPKRVYDPASGRAEIQAETATETAPTNEHLPAETNEKTVESADSGSAVITLDSDVNLISSTEERKLPPLPSPKYIYRRAGVDMATDT